MVGRRPGGGGHRARGARVLDARTGAWISGLPDGATVLRVVDGAVWTTGEGLVRWRIPRDGGVQRLAAPVGLTGAVPSPDGRSLLVVGGDGYVVQRAVADGAVRDAAPSRPWVVKDAAFSPDGGLVAVATAGIPGLSVRDASGWRHVEGAAGHRRVVVLDGDVVVGVPYTPGLHVVRPGEPLVRLPGETWLDVAAHAGGLVALDQDGGVWRATLPDLSPARFAVDARAVAIAASDGRVVLAHRDGVRVLDDAGATRLAWSSGGRALVDVAVAASGVVAAADHDGSIHVWSPEGALRARIDGHALRAASVAFAPDGTLVSAGWDGVVGRYGLDVLDASAASLAATLLAAWGPAPGG